MPVKVVSKFPITFLGITFSRRPDLYSPCDVTGAPGDLTLSMEIGLG